MRKRPSPTLQVLREIRDELKQTNVGLERVEERVEALERRQSESEVRLATELVAVAKAVQEVRDLLRDNLAVQHRVDDHERRIVALERRVEP
jgi:chromosome segregation ATPase